MLMPSQIASQIAEVAASHLSAYDFERWFRRASLNFHAYPDAVARNAVFEVENVLSEYHLGTIAQDLLARRLADAVVVGTPLHIPEDCL